MKVLLIDPQYKSDYEKFPPIGLMKISTYHKDKGDSVTYTRDTSFWFIDDDYEMIYVTTMFTWDIDNIITSIRQAKKRYPKAEIKVGGIAATISPDIIETAAGIKPHVGLLKEVEYCRLDYSLFPHIKHSIGFTTRGCIRKCSWCLVKKHEPDYIELENWFDQYYNFIKKRKRFIFCDNNFLACSEKHFDSVFDKIKSSELSIEFNQGLDCRLFDEGKAKQFSQIQINPITFAFDSMAQDGYIQNTLDLCRKYDIATDVSVLMLYNFNETPEEIYYRMSEIVRHGGNVFPMLYRDINSADDKTMKPNGKWTLEQLNNFKKYMRGYRHCCGGMIYTRNQKKFIDAFFEYFGNTENEFIDRLSRKPER